jgi:hypothetical protein
MTNRNVTKPCLFCGGAAVFVQTLVGHPASAEKDDRKQDWHEYAIYGCTRCCKEFCITGAKVAYEDLGERVK